MTTRRISGALVGLCLAAALSTGHALTAEQDTHDVETAEVAVSCDPYTWQHHTERVTAGETDPHMWDDLRSVGWQGVQSDGREALYAPECITTAEDGTTVLRTYYR